MNKTDGFSLVEIAIVLLIIALLLGTLLSPLSTMFEQRHRRQTQQQLSNIKAVVIGYMMAYGHLPCPDCPDQSVGRCNLSGAVSNDGMEDGLDAPPTTVLTDRNITPFQACATEVGYLPWATLGVSRYDPWGQDFIYAVTDDFADNIDGTQNCDIPAENVSFCLDSVSSAKLDIDDIDGARVAPRIPVIILSKGNNGKLAHTDLSVAEQENQDFDRIFVSDDLRTGEFDDLLIWIAPFELIYYMLQAERLP